jgi:plastocyanin
MSGDRRGYNRQVRRLSIVLTALATLGAGSCKKSTPTTPDPPPVATNTITITAAGATPKNIEIAIGSRVRFVNNDSRAHNMTSDPHPDHTDCPELNQVGFLNPGQSRETGNLVQIRSCGFHDHDLPNSTSLQGRVTIR